MFSRDLHLESGSIFFSALLHLPFDHVATCPAVFCRSQRWPVAAALAARATGTGEGSQRSSSLLGGYSLDFVCLVRFLDSSVRLCSQADQTAINIIYFRLVSY